MKIQKKIATAAVGAILMTAIGINSAYAGWCQSGTVVKVGFWSDFVNAQRSGHSLTVNCDGDQFSGERTFFFTADLGKSGYATAMTAKATGHKVQIRTLSNANYSLIDRIFELDTVVVP